MQSNSNNFHKGHPLKYFRAFRLLDSKSIDEYYKTSSELSIYQSNLFQASNEAPDGDYSELELKINDLHKQMHEKYGMVPHLHYHAMPEKGFVSELIDEKAHKKLLKSGEVQKGQARKLELQKDSGPEVGYSLPVFKIDSPENVQQFNQLLSKWQELKAGIKNTDSAGKKDSLEEQYEAFKVDLQEKYKMDPEKQYVFETTEIGVYMGCTEGQLSQIAEQQKVVRAHKATEVWKKSQDKA